MTFPYHPFIRTIQSTMLTWRNFTASLAQKFSPHAKRHYFVEVVIGGNTDVATQASREKHTVMFVCKLENNVIDSSPMYVSDE